MFLERFNYTDFYATKVRMKMKGQRISINHKKLALGGATTAKSNKYNI